MKAHPKEEQVGQNQDSFLSLEFVPTHKIHLQTHFFNIYQDLWALTNQADGHPSVSICAYTYSLAYIRFLRLIH